MFYLLSNFMFNWIFESGRSLERTFVGDKGPQLVSQSQITMFAAAPKLTKLSVVHCSQFNKFVLDWIMQNMKARIRTCNVGPIAAILRCGLLRYQN